MAFDFFSAVVAPKQKPLHARANAWHKRNGQTIEAEANDGKRRKNINHLLFLQQSNWIKIDCSSKEKSYHLEIFRNNTFFWLGVCVATISIVRTPRNTHKRRITFPPAPILVHAFFSHHSSADSLTQQIFLFVYCSFACVFFPSFHFVNNLSFNFDGGSHKRQNT